MPKATKFKKNKWTENKLPPYQQTKKLIEKYKLNSLKLEDPKNQPQPPWTINTPKIDLTLLKQPKKHNQPHLAKQRALEHINKKYFNHHHIYTDGSKSKMGTGAAAHTPTFTQTYKLDKRHSILTAELEAIQKALTIAKNTLKTKTQILILTDSLTSLQNLANPFQTTRAQITNAICKQITTLEKKEIKTTLLWIPSHINITGNETADKGAKYGSKHGIPLNTPIHIPELQAEIKQIFKNKFPTPPHPYLKNITHNRAIYRLRYNSTRFTHNLNNEPKSCTHCRTDNTIEHFLLHCYKYREERKCLTDTMRLLHLPVTTQTLLFPNKYLQNHIHQAIITYLIHTNTLHLL